MVIHVDTREQYPYDFECMRASAVEPFTVERMTLVTGDYCVGWPVPHLKQNMIVERKSLQDLYGTLGSGRKRFEREFERMQSYGYAALAIEAGWDLIAQPNLMLHHKTQLNPKSVIATLHAWSQRYGVHIWTFPNRAWSERLVFRALERWYRDMPERLSKAGAA